MRHHGVKILAAVVVFLSVQAGTARAAVSYTLPGSMYSQDFNTLPTDTRTNASIESGASAPQVDYPTGWQDDTATPPEGAISLEGWYLFHPISQGEGGASGNQRLRFGPGTANVGAFYGFSAGDPTNPEKALGSVTSNTMAAVGDFMFFGLRLTNDTGITLNEFTLTYNGEQWRDGGGNDGLPEQLAFSYSTTATVGDWTAPLGFKAAPALNFTAPVNFGDGNIDGNLDGRVNNISAVVTGVGWEPGADLWLRWADLSAAGNDDGLAIDDLTFSAVMGSSEPTFIRSVMSGPAETASTWSNNQPASAGNEYRVLDGHTVSISAPFPGDELRVTAGGVLQFTASGVHLPVLIVDEGGGIAETVSGDFALGDITAPTLGILQVNQELTFDMDPGADFFLDMNLFGAGDLNFNSNGSGSELYLSAAADHEGTIRFNGTGDNVYIVESESFNILEMNSTGANTIVYNPREEIGGGTLIFNQPGTVDHASTTTSPLRRLHGMNELVANAPITVDLTKGFPDDSSQAEERRLLVGNGGIHGSEDITVNGTTADYSNGASITHNEFEVGSTGEPGSVSVSTHSGTITANNYVDFEIRRHFPNSRFVINNHARLEMGHQTIASSHSIQMGEVVINNGGTLEVGFEQQAAIGTAGHHAYTLTLTSEGTRDGGLTLADGATVRMQVNGTASTDFDQIVADGDVQLNGTLNVLVNPPASTGTNPTWTPTLGDTFDIIRIAAVAPNGDYDGNGSVGPEDYDFWRANFGSSNAAADGNGNGVVDAADYTVWRSNLNGSGGTAGLISGTFDNVTVNDFTGAMAGFAFQVNYSPTAVQLQVVAGGAGLGGAVPEPSSFAMLGILFSLLWLKCPRR